MSVLEWIITWVSPNKKNKCVSGNGSENFRQGMHTYFFLTIFFLEKNIILCILKGISPFKMHKIIFFPENLKKFLGFTSKFRKGQFTLNTGIFLFGLIKGQKRL